MRTSRRHELLGGHPALGERPRLVRGDDRDRSQRLNGGQVPDYRRPAGHPVGAHGERDRHDGRQGLRYGGDRQADNATTRERLDEPLNAPPADEREYL